jgi:hypothetical protein
VLGFDLKYHRPPFYPKQFQAIFDPHRISVIEASTKAGKTSACIAWIVEEALKGKPGWNFWWVAPVSEQAAIAFRRMCRSIPRDMFNASLSHPQHIKLLNDTTVWFKSGDKPDSLYGEDVYAAVVDEASRMKDGAWIALRSTLTYTRGPIRIIGNVRGRKNWAFQLARHAERGEDSEMAYHKLTAYDAIEAGVLSQHEVESTRGTQMTEAAWRELYLAEPSDDGGNPFGEQHIRHCTVPSLSAGEPRWWGWDLAKRMDYTVGIALDQAGYVCRLERFQQVPWDQIMHRIEVATRGVPALIDSTGVGDPILDELQRKPGMNVEGYHFNQASKQKLMEGLAVVIQGHNITFPSGVIPQELMQFEYEITQTGVRYSAAEGFHDDCVIALALAVMARNLMPAPMKIPREVIERMRRSPGNPRFQQHRKRRFG